MVCSLARRGSSVQGTRLSCQAVCVCVSPALVAGGLLALTGLHSVRAQPVPRMLVTDTWAHLLTNCACIIVDMCISAMGICPQSGEVWIFGCVVVQVQVVCSCPRCARLGWLKLVQPGGNVQRLCWQADRRTSEGQWYRTGGSSPTDSTALQCYSNKTHNISCLVVKFIHKKNSSFSCSKQPYMGGARTH